MTRLRIEHLGPIASADLTFGDLTIFVGPQAGGKSLALETFKLALDRPRIVYDLKTRGYIWSELGDFLQLYYGEGMGGLWNAQTTVRLNEKIIALPQTSSARGRLKEARVFYVPAQRVLTLHDGWPRPFMDYGVDTPYVLRQFSERIRWLVSTGLGRGEAPIFPQKGRLPAALRNALSEDIFAGAKVRLEKKALRKRIVLEVAGNTLPVMVWSTGQREFVPLLLGFYYLLPSGGSSRKKFIDWVVIEEPEMGQHTRGIRALLLGVLELVRRGYRVALSTHAPQVLEMVWALRMLQEAHNGAELFCELLELPRSTFATKLWERLSTAELRTYYFERQGAEATVRDISSLDPYDPDDAVADWGGLISFSTHASDVISKAVIPEVV